MARARPPESVTITYDLFDLPTAQHKAGLAGLLLQIEHMNGRTPKVPTPRVVECTATKATIEFTAESTQGLFDELYAAAREPGQPVEKPFKNPRTKQTVPWHSRAEIEVMDKDGNAKTDRKGAVKKVDGYVYLATVPKLGPLLQHMGDKPQWIKLHRDMLWAIPFGNEQTRIPYELRAGTVRHRVKGEDGKIKVVKEDTGKPMAIPLGCETWTELLSAAESVWQHTSTLPAGLTLGAQDENAEAIPFQGYSHQNLLLHFWPLVTQVFVPAVLKIVRSEGRVDVKSEFVGYVLAVPEVADLEFFPQDYTTMLGGLGSTLRGFRPAESVIDLPAEGALSFLAHLGAQKAKGAETRHTLGSVEYLHQVKIGNNIKTQAAGRVSLRPHLLEDYQQIVGQENGRPRFGNPLFRRGLMTAMLDESLSGSQWFRPFGKLFAEWDVSFFIPTDAPPKLSWFWADARKQLRSVEARVKDADADNPPDDDDVLAATVKRLVGAYLDARLKKDGGFDFAEFRDAKKTPADAAEARRKLAERLFLELRSRRDQAFVDHFTNTFFSVGQYLGHKPAPKMFERIAKALFTRTDDVKTLTLMALSATGWVPSQKKETAQ